MAGSSVPRVGVLALQGDVREHVAALTSLAAEAVLVRTPDDLAEITGLVIPGGESSVMDKLTRAFGLAGPIRRAIGAGMPAYGTCAGLIMLADTIVDAIEGQQSLGGLDIEVRRNAFGSQLDSFEATVEFPILGQPPVHAVFIRAPLVERVGPEVSILGTLDDGRIIAVEQGNLLGTAFHPEMSGELRFHRRFLDRVRARS